MRFYIFACPGRAALALAASVAAAGFVAGCGSSNNSQNNSQGASSGHSTGSTAGTSGSTGSGGGSQVLTVISPHPAQAQNEFSRAFEAKYPGVKVKWIDKGATVEDLRFVQSQFKGKGPNEGIGIDCFFGGGGETFAELDKDGVLAPLESNFNVPATLNGVPLVGPKNSWVAAALSDFGILYNKTVLKSQGLPEPKRWADLTLPAMKGRVGLADPRHSGSAHAVFEIILQTQGWDAGWKTLNRMAANTREFSRSSSDLPQSVARGDTAAVTAINFYAFGAIDRAGKDKLGYVAPAGGSVQTPDPIGILRGAPNPDLAKKWVAFVMSPEGQKLWMLPKGAPGGPKAASLFRQPALPALYQPIPKNALVQSSPFAVKNARPYDAAKAALRRKALDDLLGATLIDNLDDVKAHAGNAAKLDWIPVSEAELLADAAKWSDAAYRTKRTSEWSNAARAHFGG
jgi:ABC-type Fe3+ transport system substrate-binding protein